jgi:hypothetical protein
VVDAATMRMPMPKGIKLQVRLKEPFTANGVKDKPNGKQAREEHKMKSPSQNQKQIPTIVMNGTKIGATRARTCSIGSNRLIQ